jgi:hypothetical protein
MTEVVECLPSKLKVLNSNPTTTKKKKPIFKFSFLSFAQSSFILVIIPANQPDPSLTLLKTEKEV